MTPVLLQSFEDEFDLTEMGKPGTPAPAGSVLSKEDKTECEAVPLAHQAYRKGVGKLLHMTRWTRREIMNAVRELSRFAGGALMGHMKAMYRAMAYCVSTSKRGITIKKPNEKWSGSPEFEFTIGGRADSDYAEDLETTRRCVSGIITFLCGAAITLR
jgi:aldehyde:ferredoxin oxidoreductase